MVENACEMPGAQPETMKERWIRERQYHLDGVARVEKILAYCEEHPEFADFCQLVYGY